MKNQLLYMRACVGTCAHVCVCVSLHPFIFYSGGSREQAKKRFFILLHDFTYPISMDKFLEKYL